MRFRVSLLVLAVAGLVWLVPGLAEACAVCLAGASGGDRIAGAFNWSILFLMGMPYTIMGSVAGWIFYAHRRAARKRNAAKGKAQVYRLTWREKESER